MHCDKCHAENRDDANFCYRCGQSVVHLRAADKEEAEIDTASLSPIAAAEESATSKQATRRVMSGRYELREMLGHGGMGVVYRACDHQLGMDVAIKFLPVQFAANFMAVECFKREARAAMRLSHPNIVRFYNFEEMAEGKYLLMEFIGGESLALIASRKPERRFAESEVIRYAGEVCDALKYAHAENVVHRDIKPSNILVTPDGRVKLADFGIALIKETATDEAENEIAGTPTYMSPEQILGKPVDGKSDIYSLGVTMYEMLAGQPPFRGKDARDRHIHEMPGPIQGVTDWMNAIVLKCLRKEPEARWQDAAELKDVLTGKKDIGIPIRSKYEPEWARAEAERRMRAPTSAVPQAPNGEVKPPEQARFGLERTPRPFTQSDVRERVEKIKRFAGFAEHASEREQARMAFGTLAGIVGGIAIVLGDRYGPWRLSHAMLLHLSWIIYAALIGLAIGAAQRKPAKLLLSFIFGIMGGLVAWLLPGWIRAATGEARLGSAQVGFFCSAVIGSFLGMSDGVYERSLTYFVRCLLWGGLGGVIGIAVFWGIKYAFSAFWLPPLNWVVAGGALGFFINMSLGLAKKPWMKR
ncbi:MAG: serine/threonine protein kinase [Candidatus Abyssobacteria bacterium SURF_17]|uniref:Serine/threonine protein kinase n=1 Tax=Candidatus Abyssobacteria bacterium SURF_17 TaxID=2093361 RepID=A0A419EN36_9BACT|nr:MAG: serine/threonine protein kinase [Candidatus Abyssubacteria bacterium SURF_17]